MNIHGCKSCFGVGKNPEHLCVQRDDMEKIYPVYTAADLEFQRATAHGFRQTYSLSSKNLLASFVTCDKFFALKKYASCDAEPELNGFTPVIYTSYRLVGLLSSAKT